MNHRVKRFIFTGRGDSSILMTDASPKPFNPTCFIVDNVLADLKNGDTKEPFVDLDKTETKLEII